MRYLSCILLSIPVILGSCATPSQPTGGPRDTTGPEIIQTYPENGTVNFDDDRIVFEFSDYISRSSFQTAFRIEPDLGIQYNIRHGRTSTRVIFEDELPDTTTMIFNVGTDLTNTRNNRMAGPYQLAISTGPDIDSAEIQAAVRDAETGEPVQDARVFLYREPYDLTERANYSVQTDTAGIASFNYLREGRYRGFWVDDRNRNQTWDPPRESAQPFPLEWVRVERDSMASFGTLFVTREDTIAPELRGVGLLSASRMRLRFSENIELTPGAEVNVYSMDGEPWSNAIPLYKDDGDPAILFAQSERDFEEEADYTLELNGIEDAAGNEAYSAIESFPGSGEPDTTWLSYREHITASGIYAGDPLVFQYSKLIDDDVILDSLKVIAGDTLIENWPRAEIEHNQLLVYPDTVWERGPQYEIRIWDPSTLNFEHIEPVVWHEGDLGEIELIVEEPDTAYVRHYYSLYDNDGTLTTRGSFRDTVLIDRLPPQNYRLVVFEDTDGSGSWNPGRVEPYRAPEPYFIQRNIPVQTNLTGQVYIEWPDP